MNVNKILRDVHDEIPDHLIFKCDVKNMDKVFTTMIEYTPKFMQEDLKIATLVVLIKEISENFGFPEEDWQKNIAKILNGVKR